MGFDKYRATSVRTVYPHLKYEAGEQEGLPRIQVWKASPIVGYSFGTETRKLLENNILWVSSILKCLLKIVFFLTLK